jgi:exonuclease VII small subunit
MVKNFILVSMLGLGLSSCSVVTSLQNNQAAIDHSTYVIEENAQAVAEANTKIRENRQRLTEINKTLQKAGENK